MNTDLLNSLASVSGNNNATAANARTATVTPAQTGAADAQQRAEDLSHRFLKLLVAQMQNQDPLKPMDNAQVTSQIAQINTVSGINDLNDRLKSITGQIDTSQQLQASALIGRDVLTPGDKISVGDSGAATAFGVDLPADAASLDLTISDTTGTVVHKSSYTDQPAGVQSFSWDATAAGGDPVDPGRYQIHVKAVDSDGDPVQAQPLAMGYVAGVVATGDGPRLDLGPNGQASLADVYQIVGK